jgi:WD40 repeat protein
VRNPYLAVSWLFFLACPSLLGFLVLWARAPKAIVYSTPDYVLQVVMSPDRRTLAATEIEGNITLLDVESRQARVTLHANSRFPEVVFSPDSSMIASTGRPARVWDTASGTELLKVECEHGSYLNVAFTSDGRSLITSSRFWMNGREDRTIRFWDLKSGRNCSSWELDSETFDLLLNPAGTLLATKSKDGLRLWDVGTRSLRTKLSDENWYALTFSPDGRTFAAHRDIYLKGVIQETHIGLWDVETGARLPAEPARWTLDGYNDSYTGRLQFSPDGKRLFLCRRAASYDDETEDWESTARVLIWDVATGRRTHSLGRGPDQIHPPGRHLGYWWRIGSTPDAEAVLFPTTGEIQLLERDRHNCGLRALDFHAGWYYRAVSLVVIVLTLALAVFAVRYWLRVEIQWQLRWLLLLTTTVGLFFLCSYLSVFWVEAWCENTMPFDWFLFRRAFWHGFLFAFATVLFVPTLVRGVLVRLLHAGVLVLSVPALVRIVWSAQRPAWPGWAAIAELLFGRLSSGAVVIGVQCLCCFFLACWAAQDLRYPVGAHTREFWTGVLVASLLVFFVPSVCRVEPSGQSPEHSRVVVWTALPFGLFGRRVVHGSAASSSDDAPVNPSERASAGAQE